MTLNNKRETPQGTCDGKCLLLEMEWYVFELSFLTDMIPIDIRPKDSRQWYNTFMNDIIWYDKGEFDNGFFSVNKPILIKDNST